MKKTVNWSFIYQKGFTFSLFCYLIFLGGRGDVIARYWMVYCINLCIFAIISIAILILAIRNRIKFSNFSFYGPIIFLLGTTIISVIVSQNSWASATEIYYWGLYLITFVALVSFRSCGWSQENMLRVYLVVGGLFIAVKIIPFFQWFYLWLVNIPSIFPPVLMYRPNAPNLAGGVANLVLFISGGLLISQSRPKKRIPYAIIMFGACFLLWVSSSRGAWIGFLGGLSFMGFLYISEHKQKTLKLWNNNKWFVILGGAVFSVGLVWIVSFIIERIANGISPRVEMWKLAITLIKTKPLFGIGLYSYGRFANGLTSLSPFQVFAHSHNIFINILVEQGVVGLIGFLIVAAVIIKYYVKEFESTKSLIILAALGALGSFLAHGLVDTLYVEPYYTFALVLLLGITMPSVGSKNSPKDVLVHWGIIILLPVVIGWGVYLGYQRYPLQRGVELAYTNRLASEVQFSEALSRSEGSPLVLQQMGLNYSILAIDQDEQKNHYLRKAKNVFEYAVSADPYWFLNYANLGTLQYTLGNEKMALSNIAQAAMLAPESPLIILNQAIIAEYAGEMDLADSSYRKYLSLRGINPSGPFWQQTHLRREIFESDWVNEEEIINGPITIGWITQNLEANPWDVSLRLKLAMKYIELGYFDKARQEILVTRLSSPYQPKQDNQSFALGLELDWIDACIDFKEGDINQGLSKAEEVFDGWRYQSIQGPGKYWASEYGKNIFRNPSQAIDVIPQLILEPMPANWIDKMVILGEWYLEVEDNIQAKKIFTEVLAMDPENSQAKKYLEEISTN